MLNLLLFPRNRLCCYTLHSQTSQREWGASVSKNKATFKISPDHTAAEWLALSLDPNAHGHKDWTTAVSILKDRIEERFLKPADQLIQSQRNDCRATFGFAILALDFLVIETIQGFREGLTNHARQSTRLFTDFLTGWKPFTDAFAATNLVDAQKTAIKLYINGRCALHHSGSTDNLSVDRTGSVAIKFNPDGTIHINRNEFHQAVSDEFESYLHALLAPGNADLRAKMKTKMDAIAKG